MMIWADLLPVCPHRLVQAVSRLLKGERWGGRRRGLPVHVACVKQSSSNPTIYGQVCEHANIVLMAGFWMPT